MIVAVLAIIVLVIFLASRTAKAAPATKPDIEQLLEMAPAPLETVGPVAIASKRRIDGLLYTIHSRYYTEEEADAMREKLSDWGNFQDVIVYPGEGTPKWRVYVR